MNEKEHIHDWQEKVRSSFGDEARLYQYMFETLDNFYYRYIETGLSKDLKTTELSPGIWGAISFENDMVQALKVQSHETKAVVMELAKSVPKSQNPQIRYSIKANVRELTAEHGYVIFETEVQGLQSVKKEVIFKYGELAQFRKELALKLEAACEIFL
ncbi:MAG TPA: hypothetical protein VNJ08_16540 [Bacteriovoracaceae bacterium]|nr:hypothetical protein [Bacteriovoracaceae bacterium]